MSEIAEEEVVLTSRYWQSYQPGSARSTVKSVHQPIAHSKRRIRVYNNELP